MVALLHPQTHQPASRRRPPAVERAAVDRTNTGPGADRHLALVPRHRPVDQDAAMAVGSVGAWLKQLDRRVLGVVGAVIVAFMALSLAQGGPPADAGVVIETQAVGELQAGESFVVAVSGDTYWQIASALVADGDIRPVVQQLVDRNGSANLQIGQRVIIPADFG